MELCDGNVKMAPGKSIHFPNEILDKILNILPTKDLIRCRSVSNLWKSLTSGICRRRHVTLTDPNLNLDSQFGSKLEMEEFYEIFKQSADLPWSACVLDFPKNSEPHVAKDGNEVQENFCDLELELKRFTKNFGPNMRKLKLHGRNMDLVKIALMEMPNLEVLISKMRLTAKDMRRSCSGNRFELNKLKRLKFVVRDMAQVEFLELLVESAPNLESILVVYIDNYEYDPLATQLYQAELSGIATRIGRIASIPSIGFRFWNGGTAELFQTIKSPGLHIKTLQIGHRSDVDVIDDHYIRALEEILAGSSNCLEKLSMYCACSDGSRLVDRLQIPVFSKLKEMEFYWSFVSSENQNFLQPFTSSQFPILTKLGIHIYGTENNDQLATVFGSKPFELVQNLSIYNELNPTIIDWRLFPNVLTLEVDYVTRGSHSIYQKMIKLEHLYLRVIGNFPTDSSAIICGYPKNTKKNCDRTGQNRSLSCLTNLKTLKLNFGYTEEENFPSEVHLALLHLHPIDVLTLTAIEISEEVTNKLSAYHKNVDVQH